MSVRREGDDGMVSTKLLGTRLHSNLPFSLPNHRKHQGLKFRVGTMSVRDRILESVNFGYVPTMIVSLSKEGCPVILKFLFD